MTEEERDASERSRVEAEENRVIAEHDRVDAEIGEGGSLLEESRVRAEEQRVELELNRRIAEGGPDQHVLGNVLPGRVEAEEARVIAEEKREVSANQVYRRVTGLWAMRVVLICLVPFIVFGIFLYRDNQRLDVTIDKLEAEIALRCQTAAENRGILRSLIANGLESLGYTFDTTHPDQYVVNAKGPIDYYKTRPKERREALHRTLRILKTAVPPIVCEEGGNNG